jgi:hypothetical protein
MRLQGVFVASLVAAAACASNEAEGPLAVDDATARAAAPDARDPARAGQDAGVLPADAEFAQDPSLPYIHDRSGASEARVKELVRAALDGLGFAGPEAPNPNDRVFIGKHYLAWIDQTGFYGKMNGLWVLDGASGDALDFSLKDPDGRPVNMFIPGEDGEGRFAGGYKGGEHVEFPNRVPEANDNPSCGNGDWCNQYGLNEAPPITNPRIPWWSACNAGAPSFTKKFDPAVVTELPDGGLKLVYEGPLVKEADGDGNYDGDACHQDYLFPDKVRRKVILRVGYELHPDKDYFDRTQQLYNPPGNPKLAGDMSLIGGFVMTAFPEPHYLKRFHRFFRPEEKAIQIQWNGAVTLPAATWTGLFGRAAPTKDVIVAWAKQPFSVSATNDYAAGRAATIAHVGASDNDDVGGCLCVVHGAIELGGGLIHAGTSLPIDGGQETIEGTRRLTVPSSVKLGSVSGKTYEPKSMGHNVGRAEGDGWSANTGDDAAGHMLFGPYATDWGGGAAEAVFSMMVDNVTASDDVVVTLDIYDGTTGTILSQREVRRREFRKASEFQRFTLDAGLEGRAGHKMEVRAWWQDKSYVKIGSLRVHLSDF